MEVVRRYPIKFMYWNRDNNINQFILLGKRGMIPREDIMPRFFLLRGTKCTIKVSNPLSALGLLFQLFYLRVELTNLRFVIFTVLFQFLLFYRDGLLVIA